MELHKTQYRVASQEPSQEKNACPSGSLENVQYLEAIGFIPRGKKFSLAWGNNKLHFGDRNPTLDYVDLSESPLYWNWTLAAAKLEHDNSNSKKKKESTLYRKGYRLDSWNMELSHTFQEQSSCIKPGTPGCFHGQCSSLSLKLQYVGPLKVTESHLAKQSSRKE